MRFSSLRATDADSAILNLEEGRPVEGWGRLILHVAGADALWRRFNELGFKSEKPRNASWSERYFHMLDADGMSCRLRARYCQRHEHGEPQTLPEDEHKKKPSASVPKARDD